MRQLGSMFFIHYK